MNICREHLCQNGGMRSRSLVACLGALIFLSACGVSEQRAINISSESVASLSVNLKEVPRFTRIVALANGSAEIIDSMGLKKYIVGRDIASTDSSLTNIPIVASGHQVIAEKVIALNPDVVIIDSSVGPAQAISAINKAGISVLSIDEVWKVEDISSKVLQIAGILKTPQSGAALAREITDSINQSSKVISGKPRVAFLYLRGGNSIYLLGGKGSGADSLLASIGAIDIGAQISSTPFTSLTSESFATTQPEIILVMTKGLESVGGVHGLVALPGIAQSPAGKNAKIISVDDSLLLSFGPRTPELLRLLAKAINEVRR